MTSDDVREYFEYRDGGMYWKKEPSKHGKRKKGERFGHTAANGYRAGKFRKNRVLEHRLVWLMFNNSLPEMLDHIDGNRENNRIENLRAITYSQNAHNARLRQDNKSGHKGVWVTPYGTYHVRLSVNNRCVRFGTFKDFELACLVADEARDLYHGKYARNK